MSKRFEVLNHQAATVAGLDVPYDDHKNVLVENMPDGTRREITWDYGEPEDNSFLRDWAFVPALLNKLAAEAAEWRAKYEALLPK